MNLAIRSIIYLGLALLATRGVGTAQPKGHPFELPPILKGDATPTAELTRYVRRPVQRQNCEPKGTLVRDGNIVRASLNLVRADFTINNPDPDSAHGGEDPVTLRSYGGCKSGPVIELLPGNTLRMELINDLDKDDPSCLANPPKGLSLPPGVGCFNTTNLHTHGLHVSPAGNSDNVLLSIDPKTKFPYEINLPADHPAGTFWYHAHRHGSTAVQVASGGSGVLLVRGNRPYGAPTPQNPRPIADIDTILHDTRGVPMVERLFLFQQIPYACFDNDPTLPGGPWQQIYTSAGLYTVNSSSSEPNGPANAPWTCPKSDPGKPVSRGVIENFALQLGSPTIWDTNGRFTSINGIVQPTLTVPAGEIQRWRFIHAGIHDTINLQVVRATPAGGKNVIATSGLAGHRGEQISAVEAACPATPQTLIPQFEIASDGLTRTKMRTLAGSSVSGSVGSNFLQPGYRSDILIVFPEDGYYCLLNQAAPPTERASNGGRGQGPGGQGPSRQQLLAYIHVKGGRAIKTDLQTHVYKALHAANSQLPPAVRNGLLKGDLSPWAPFTHLEPAPKGNELQKANFVINNGFLINGKSYDPDVINITRQVNTTDDWLLTAEKEPHIFHIHVNPFEVIDVTKKGADGKQESIFDKDGNCKASLEKDPHGLRSQYCGMYRTFRDTVFVENGYQVHIRTHYERYIGEYVIHCHILDHEDAGMMLNIAIVPDLNAPGGGLGMKGMKHSH